MDITEDRHRNFMIRAVELARFAVENNLGGPFGAVVVQNGKIIGEGFNQVTSLNDPTAHAEVMAIRNACRNLDSFQLEGCEIYSSCEPCPMCLGAIYWARPERLFYGSGRTDAALAGFDDEFIYAELDLPEKERKIKTIFIPDNQAIEVFKLWNMKENKKRY